VSLKGTGGWVQIELAGGEDPLEGDRVDIDARVQVDPKVKDAWGIPVARLSGGRHPHTIETG